MIAAATGRTPDAPTCTTDRPFRLGDAAGSRAGADPLLADAPGTMKVRLDRGPLFQDEPRMG
jgi:hypothetical protein